MHRIAFLTLSFILCANINAQVSFKTGNIELESDLNKINAKAKLDFGAFKSEMSVSYDISEKKIDHMNVELKMEPAEIYLACEISKISRRPINDVIESYKINKSKGWGHIAKQMGIKPGSPEFHQLKASSYSQSGGKHEKGKGKGKGKPKKGKKK